MQDRSTAGFNLLTSSFRLQLSLDSFIAHHLQGVSRTYALVVPLLPAPLDDTVGLAYLVMRIIDTVEDADGLTPAQRRAGFTRITAACQDPAAAAALRELPGDTLEERALLFEAPRVFTQLADLPAAERVAVVRCAGAMMEGVQTLLVRAADRGRPYPAIANIVELREYCYYVAGVVGELLCELMALHLRQPGLRELRPAAVELGTGLQLVNILKDAPQDATHGRRYLPGGTGAPNGHRVEYAEALQLARHCLRGGLRYLLALPATAPGLRRFCGLPMVWGALTLARADRDAAAAKISRTELFETMARFEREAADDAALRVWFDDLLPAAET